MGVSKSFGGTRALDGVDLELRAGEVHVLAGQNGAGKSTLLKILCGVFPPDAGSVVVTSGVAAIHQELSLVGALSVTDNLLLGEPGALGWLTPRERRERARSILGRMVFDIDPDLLVETLPLATRQLVEIARALARDARVLVMDEPTSALSEPEAERLFAKIDTLRDAGCALLYISHRMEEIYRLADRITVLRDGRCVVSAAPGALDEAALVQHMIGRAASPVEPRAVSAGGAPLLEVTDLVGAGISVPALSLSRGAVVGVTGRRGSGVELLLGALFGAVPSRARFRLDGAPIDITDPRSAIARGIILLSGDRHMSLIGPLSVAHNAALSALGRFSSSFPLWVDRASESSAVRSAIQRLAVVCPSLDAPVWQLSGGNQQKVALARGLLAEPRVLLLDEPTRGIDVGAREDVYQLIAEFARGGAAILMSSSESEELVRVCDRVLVLSDGKIAAELAGPTLCREGIIAASLGEAAA